MSVVRMEHEGQSTSGTAYWACQLLGWGGYGVAYYLAVLVPFHSAGLPQALADAAYCAAGLVGTHLMRLVMKRRAWNELSYGRLAPRLMIGALLVGTLQTAVLDGSLALEGGTDWSRAPILPIIGVTIFFSALLVGMWLAVYLAVLAVRRRRAAEMNALRAELAGREARLRSLQQQLNPHFLFNCLNSLRGMIDEDRGRAQQMVTRLAELLRASLRADETSAIPLEEELATVDAYLDLESVRLEERLRIRREIEPAARGALVPSMLVQGLVENALKHGIAQLPQGGGLVLRVAREGETLRVEVGNTGRLRTDQSGGIGLRNARERLRLLYGERAGVDLSEEPAGWVRATVVLPFQTTEAACER
jgi:two-component system, LytTR family, sensor histidine kinase AlgZ